MFPPWSVLHGGVVSRRDRAGQLGVGSGHLLGREHDQTPWSGWRLLTAQAHRGERKRSVPRLDYCCWWWCVGGMCVCREEGIGRGGDLVTEMSFVPNSFFEVRGGPETCEYLHLSSCVCVCRPCVSLMVWNLAGVVQTAPPLPWPSRNRSFSTPHAKMRVAESLATLREPAFHWFSSASPEQEPPSNSARRGGQPPRTGPVPSRQGRWALRG